MSGLRVVMGELGISPAVSGNKALLTPIWEHSSGTLPVSPVSQKHHKLLSSTDLVTHAAVKSGNRFRKLCSAIWLLCVTTLVYLIVILFNYICV